MNSLNKGIIVWILVSTILVSCCFGAKSVPVKRRMVLRLPFVHNQENSQTFQHRNFLRMLNGNSKTKKALNLEDAATEPNEDFAKHIYMFRRVI
ncbi:Neuropeptide-Like Protein [Caenorhabditis elegans]|uniref:Neuropeptide-Like Protein n=1 Tax=Caenorhabditis elegans TaxID=6239 RepID=G4SLZ9_CAEEL|nr:Neuropeptide-Like Protein [Caenorhabditis elegans]CCD72389.1 Neuropeptide-Like Protein [Caenorhabditis elegans]|eukprot:NP_001033334.1 Uncharacterized protein CELE_H17B01.5 [Caenorhabditis elegans]